MVGSSWGEHVQKGTSQGANTNVGNEKEVFSDPEAGLTANAINQISRKVWSVGADTDTDRDLQGRRTLEHFMRLGMASRFKMRICPT